MTRLRCGGVATFYDLFSGHAGAYAAHRPRYPRALFQLLAEQAPSDRLAADVATGSGQAAVALAEFFQRVIASDASESQIAHAEPNLRIAYAVAPADRLPVDDRSCDLLTVAQALHWLDLDPFYEEARRALKPDGVIAAWCYAQTRVGEPVDAIVNRLYSEILGPFWAPRRRHVETGYADLPFPFAEIPTPRFQIEEHWTCAQFCAYLRTWSAAKICQARTGRDAVGEVEPDLQRAWGEEARPVRWPLFVRLGRCR